MKKVLAILITLTLLISALCFGASAVGSVAQIDTVLYGSLAEALAAVQDGQTITLLQDIDTTETIVFSSATAKSFTIDGNGYTLSSAVAYVSSSNPGGALKFATACNVTIKNFSIKYTDSAKMVENGKLGAAAIVLNDGVKATLENVNTITYWGDGLQVNSGAELVIKSGSFIIDENNNGLESNLICTDGAAKLTIDGGTFERLATGIIRAVIRTNGKGADITINGGSVKATCGRLINPNNDGSSTIITKVLITGGKFEFGDGVTQGDPVFNLAKKYTVVTITGGEFTTNSSCIMFYSGSKTGTKTVISGGIFTGSATDIAKVKSSAVEGSIFNETATSITVSQPAPQTGDRFVVYGIVAMVALFGTALLVKKVHD